jgi:hypothetical protein
VLPEFPEFPEFPGEPDIPIDIMVPVPVTFLATIHTTPPPKPPTPPAPPFPPTPPKPAVIPVTVPGLPGLPRPPGTPTVAEWGFGAPVLPVAAPSAPAEPSLPGHVSLFVRIAGVPSSPLCPSEPTLPCEPPPIAVIPDIGSVKTPPDMALMSLYKKLGSTGMFGFTEPPPCPPARYVITDCPLRVPSLTADAVSPTTPPDTEPIPMCPLMVNVSLTKTLYPLVKRTPPL